jgi:hypothetical protein
MRVFAAIGVLLVLSGCGGLGGVATPLSGIGGAVRGNSGEVDGMRFRTRITSDRDDRRTFRTMTQAAARAPEGAAEAGRLEAIAYCLRTFGGSQIEWAVEPDAVAATPVLGESGALSLQGRCVAR